MIGFFRRIRKKLADDNQFVKYSRYAIGEIVLVMVGILLALQVNNWNGERKDKEKEKQILQGLYEEFYENLNELSLKIEINTNVRNATVLFIEEIRKENPFEYPKKIDSLLVEIYMYATFDAETGLLDEIISSGKLSLIKNPVLQRKLARWSGKINNIEEDYRFRDEHYNNGLLPFTQNNLRLSNGDNYINLGIFGNDTIHRLKIIPESPFMPRYTKIDLLLLENLLWQHKTDNEFVIMDELVLKQFILDIISQIEKEIEL